MIESAKIFTVGERFAGSHRDDSQDDEQFDESWERSRGVGALPSHVRPSLPGVTSLTRFLVYARIKTKQTRTWIVANT